jgi:hypothetical protein
VITLVQSHVHHRRLSLEEVQWFVYQRHIAHKDVVKEIAIVAL